ncbi:MAG: hypothetical protein M2R45_03854 [Verrucomicrobia subdivision 3 bacterium]|nr:hypothetical protein [Limisphaerales bacterium]MCS1415810.1 hypothetical protein [Limisphaerales bacterium]
MVIRWGDIDVKVLLENGKLVIFPRKEGSLITKRSPWIPVYKGGKGNLVKRLMVVAEFRLSGEGSCQESGGAIRAWAEGEIRLPGRSLASSWGNFPR